MCHSWLRQVAMGPTQAMHRPLGSRLVQLHTLETIMGGLGHTWLDVLKVDVEGFEWGVLEALVGADEPLPFTQLQARASFSLGWCMSLWELLPSQGAVQVVRTSKVNLQVAQLLGSLPVLLCHSPL